MTGTLSLRQMWGAVHPREVCACPLCGRPGDRFHQEVADHNFGWPGSWSHYRCCDCDLLWLAVDDLPKPPADRPAYYTHHEPGAAPWWRTLLGGGTDCRDGAGSHPGQGRSHSGAARRALALVPTVRNLSTFTVLGIGRGEGRALLDVGCGAGVFLSKARALGWQVTGVEPDGLACEVARRAGHRVINGTVDSVAASDGRFAMITLNHVIEHVADPVQTLRACEGLLTPGGRIAVATPNLAGAGHRRFGAFWRELDAPRHLQLFSGAAIRQVFERAGLQAPTVIYSARTALQVWPRSRLAMAGTPPPPIGTVPEPRSWLGLCARGGATLLAGGFRRRTAGDRL